MSTEDQSTPNPTTPSLRLAVLGLGAMGARMAERLSKGGHGLRVWNRSGIPRANGSLEKFAARSPREAVLEADIVIAMLRDDAASEDVWLTEEYGALSAMKPGAVVVECSTLTPSWVKRLASACSSQQLEFVDAPVVGSRPQAESGTLSFLAGGRRDTVERLTPLLLTLGANVHHLGDSPAGTVAKLVVNGLFGVQVAALAELLAFAERLSLNLDSFVPLLTSLPVMSPASSAAAQAMVQGRFEPLFPVNLAQKDLHYAHRTATEHQTQLPLISVAEQVFSRVNERGWAAENLTAAIKLYRNIR